MGTHIYLNAVEDSNFTKEYLNELYKTLLENQIKFYENSKSVSVTLIVTGHFNYLIMNELLQFNCCASFF